MMMAPDLRRRFTLALKETQADIGRTEGFHASAAPAKDNANTIATIVYVEHCRPVGGRLFHWRVVLSHDALRV